MSRPAFRPSVLLFWTAVTVLFELLALARVWLLREGVAQVQPLYALMAAAETPSRLHFTLIAGSLTIVRTVTVAFPYSPAAWAASALVHSLELMVFLTGAGAGALAALAPPPRGLPRSAAALLEPRFHGLVILALVALNALLFMRAYLAASLANAARRAADHAAKRS